MPDERGVTEAPDFTPEQGAPGSARPEVQENGDQRPPARHRLSVSEAGERFGLVAFWALVIVIFSIWLPDTFATWRNVQTMFASQTVLLVLTLALVVALSAAEFDLSIAAVAGFTGTVFAELTVQEGWPVGVGVVFAVVVGVVIGAINGIVVVKVRVPSIVMTLGTSTLLVGLSIGLAGPAPVAVDTSGLVAFANERIAGLPVVWFAALGLCVLLYYLLEHTPLGRYIRFVGASHEVSRLSGIRVDAVRIFALTASATLAAVAGLMLVFLQGASDINASTGFLLPAFAGAFLGATTLSPGRFNVWGTFVAVYFLVTGVTGLQLAGLSGWVEQVFYGVSLIVGVAVAQLLSRGVRSPTGVNAG